MIVKGDSLGPILEGLVREQEGEIGNMKPYQFQEGELLQMENIIARFEDTEDITGVHPYETEPEIEVNIELSDSDCDLIRRITNLDPRESLSEFVKRVQREGNPRS